MNIIQIELFLRDMTLGNKPNTIILHHAEASRCSVEDINGWHKSNGWAGIGYHYFVRKDGSIYKGRPDNAIGAHAQGYNTNSLGICAEGKYSEETMPDAQINALRGLITELKSKYGITSVKKHSDVNSTSCPGTNYPFDVIVNGNTVQTAQSTPQVVQAPVSKGNDIVRTLQAECNTQGFSRQIVDGIAGTNTLNGCPMIRQGSQGRITMCLQNLLMSHGYALPQFGADSDFGGETLSAVMRFQMDKGLGADGIVGQNTWRALLRL